MSERRRPGVVRDAIVTTLQKSKEALTLEQIRLGVEKELGEGVPASSIRSYLGLNTPGLFIRTERGTYRLVRR